jgi:hypothetical protein
MTQEEQEAQTILWGLKAKTVLENEAYQQLTTFMQKEISEAILATPLNERDYREELYQIYNGMRAFNGRLDGLLAASLAILEARDQDTLSAANEQPDFEDD